MSSFDFAIKGVLENEGALNPDGGYVCDKNDLGGATKGGISLRFYKTIKADATAKDIKELDLEKITYLYKQYFWTPNNYDKISNQRIANYVFDACVNHGPKQANKFLQRAIWTLDDFPSVVVDDGVLGVTTLSKCNAAYIDNLALLCAMKAERANFFRNLVKKNPSQEKFLKGWLKRCYKQ